MKVEVPAVPPEGSHSLDQQRRAGVTRRLRRFSEPEQDRVLAGRPVVSLGSKESKMKINTT